MRNLLKSKTLESKFPLLAVEEGIIISKDADITIAFRVDLPEIFTMTSQEYESLHSTWVKAVKILPEYTIVHKQDWFISEQYKPELSGENKSFLSRSYERHFNERPFLNHSCFLYITMTTSQRMKMQSNFSTLCRGFIIPKEVNKESTTKFLEAIGQFERIINDSGFVTLTRLTEKEIIGEQNVSGLLEKYFSLSLEETTSLQDIQLKGDAVRIGDKILCVHTISDTEDLPEKVKTDMRFERLSTDKSYTALSFAAPVGLMLSCDHIYNQYLFIDDSSENLKNFEKLARNMHSLSKYSRSNQINKEWIEEYLNEAHSFGLTSIRAHCNIIAWSDDEKEFKKIRNEVGSQIALMDCKPRHNTVDAATLFWAGIPGNSADFPSEESFYTFIEPALCFFTAETNYMDSVSHFGMKMVERISGKPIHVDISDLPMKQGVITNRNKFVLGPSGSGKSFFTNHMMRNYYEQGSHIIIVDMGNSYQGLFNWIKQKTKGEDGVYFCYTKENPISFNPFYTQDGIYDIEKIESLKTLIISLWKRNGEQILGAEEVTISNAVSKYVECVLEGKYKPCFDTFYDFINIEYRSILEDKGIREKEFDIKNFLYVLEPFYKNGEYGYLLNSEKGIDLMSKRAILFEIDSIKDNKVLFPVVTLVIMEAYVNKLRRLPGIRKVMLQEEAWKALSKGAMAEFLKYLYKTVRKYYGEVITVTQEVDDIISSEVVKESIIMNADCKILLDQRKYLNKFDSIQSLLGLTDKEKAQILSINLANHQGRKYKEVWIGLGGTKSHVYGTEVSLEEYYTYTTEEVEKVELLVLSDRLGGDTELAIKQLAESKRS